MNPTDEQPKPSPYGWQYSHWANIFCGISFHTKERQTLVNSDVFKPVLFPYGDRIHKVPQFCNAILN